jgi:hypothetical protein
MLAQWHLHVLLHRQAREKRAHLKHHTEAALEPFARGEIERV